MTRRERRGTRLGVGESRAGAIGLGLFLWLGAHMRYVWTLKIYYVDPG